MPNVENKNFYFPILYSLYMEKTVYTYLSSMYIAISIY